MCGGRPCIKYVYDMWKEAYEDHGQLMVDLLNEFKLAAASDFERCSLLKEFFCSETIPRNILKALTGGTMDQYTPKVTSLFLHYFTTEEHSTKLQTGKYQPKFVRLGTIDNENTEDGYDADEHDVELSFMCEKALQLVLLFNNLLGSEIVTLTASRPNLCECDEETKLMAAIYGQSRACVESLFNFLEVTESGLRVRIGEYDLPHGIGRPDLSVSVCIVDEPSGRIISSKCVSVLEFKKANSGFWLAWSLLAGKGWTEQERGAFFALRDLPSSKFTEKTLRSWQTGRSAAWRLAEEVLDEVGTSRVEIRYLANKKWNPQNPGQSEKPALDMPLTAQAESSDKPPAKRQRIEEQAESSGNADGSDNKTTTGQKFLPSYYIRTGDNNDVDITAKLEGASTRASFDNCLKAVGKATEYASLALCSRIVIADGLTIIAGSLHEVTVAEGDRTTPNSEDVIDINFYKTHVMQSHERDSSLKFTNHLCNGIFSVPHFRKVGYKLLSFAKRYAGNVTQENRDELFQLMRNHTFRFENQQQHGASNPGLQRSYDIYNRQRRAAVAAALADFDKDYPELKIMAKQSTSDAFIISEYFRESVHDGAESSESLNGRSLSVAKVQRRGDNENYFVLKQYSGDKESVERMARELEAYRRVSKLPLFERTRHVAELVSFGSFDLDEGIPRLYMLLEYVERGAMMGFDPELISEQVTKVNDLLLSVGVSHNDLDERNYNWQLELDGRWYIKVFDFDHATFKQVPKSERRHVLVCDRTTDTQLIR